MLLGASDLVSAPSARADAERERRHWRARAVPSISLPDSSSMSLIADFVAHTTTLCAQMLSNMTNFDIVILRRRRL